MTDYSVDSLLRGIESAKDNIKTFEEAIEKERQTIKEYRFMIDTVERKEREAKVRDEILKNIEVIREEDENDD